jgi:uncharacterized protein (DUF58 family)
MTVSDVPILKSRHGRWARSGSVVSSLIVGLLAIVAVVGAVVGDVLVTALCGLVLVLVYVSRLWARLAFAEVDYHCLPSGERFMLGDEIDLSLVVENRKPLPLPWFSFSEFIPSGLEIESDRRATQDLFRTNEIRETASLGQYERIRFHHRLRAARRGIYAFGPTRIVSSDLFGFYEARLETPKRAPQIVVYPAVVPLPDFDLLSSRPIGDVWRGVHLNEDPTRPSGLREYRPGDPARHIDWKATARRDAVFVRTYDPSVSQRVVILLDCDTSLTAWRFHRQTLEAAVSGAASVAARLTDLGYAVGLVCNGSMAGRLSMPVVAPGAGPEQLSELMTTLAGAGAMTRGALEDVVARHGPGTVPPGAAIVVVTGIFRPSSVDFLRTLIGRGHRLQTVYVGEENPPDLPELNIADYRGIFSSGPELWDD